MRTFRVEFTYNRHVVLHIAAEDELEIEEFLEHNETFCAFEDAEDLIDSDETYPIEESYTITPSGLTPLARIVEGRLEEIES